MKLLEVLADVEHEQWMEWSNGIRKNLEDLVDLVLDEMEFELMKPPHQEIIKETEERLERWDKYNVPYDELDEDVKESDREYARKVMDAILEYRENENGVEKED